MLFMFGDRKPHRFPLKTALGDIDIKENRIH
jgi:hypothetical protein